MTETPAPVAVLEGDSARTSTSLRRADWRFLLPTPSCGWFDRAIVLGGPSDIATVVKSVGLAREVVTTLDIATPPADLVIVLAGAVERLSQAIASLAPGGVLYCEIDRRRQWRLTRARVCRQLRRHGLRTDAVYWVIPGFDAALRFVPLDTPAALRWYLHEVCQQRSLARSTAALVARGMARLGTEPASWAMRCLAIVAVRDPAHSHIDRRPPAWAVNGHVRASTEPAHAALITSGQDDGSRVVLLPFGRGQERPTTVVKIPRHPRHNDRTVGEHLTLTNLRQRLGPTWRTSLPTPLRIATRDRVAVTFETYAPGPSLLVSSSHRLTTARRRLADLELTMEWLVAFNRECTTATICWSAAERRDVGARIAAFVATCGINPWRERLARAIERRATDLEGLTIPLVTQHNDLGPWNVHRDGSHVTVIDWEVNGGAPETRQGLPMTDAVYFTAHWLFAARRLRDSRQQLAAFRELVTGAGRDRLTSGAREALQAYSDALAIDRRFIPLLVALTWIDRGNDRVFRARGETSPNGDPALAAYCRYVDQMGAETDALFQQAFHG